MNALQKAVKAAIDAASVGATFYDGDPETGAVPRIQVASMYFSGDDADEIAAREAYLYLRVISEDDGELHPAAALVDRVYGALHLAALSLDTPYACVECDVILARTDASGNGKTAEGILHVKALIEDQT